MTRHIGKLFPRCFLCFLPQSPLTPSLPCRVQITNSTLPIFSTQREKLAPFFAPQKEPKKCTEIGQMRKQKPRNGYSGASISHFRRKKSAIDGSSRMLPGWVGEGFAGPCRRGQALDSWLPSSGAWCDPMRRLRPCHDGVAGRLPPSHGFA